MPSTFVTAARLLHCRSTRRKLGHIVSRNGLQGFDLRLRSFALRQCSFDGFFGDTDFVGRGFRWLDFFGDSFGSSRYLDGQLLCSGFELAAASDNDLSSGSFAAASSVFVAASETTVATSCLAASAVAPGSAPYLPRLPLFSPPTLEQRALQSPRRHRRPQFVRRAASTRAFVTASAACWLAAVSFVSSVSSGGICGAIPSAVKSSASGRSIDR